MQNSPRNSRPIRQRVLTGHRVYVALALLALVVMSGITLHRTSTPKAVQAVQTSQVQRGATFLETVGFKNPIYLGIKPATEGEYPTYRALAIGGKPIELFIRTTRKGGLEIQLVNTIDTVASADDLAYKAVDAKTKWEYRDKNLKPSGDPNVWGEYEGLKYDAEELGQYDPGESYWSLGSADETNGWPRK